MEILKGYLKYTKWADSPKDSSPVISKISPHQQLSPSFSLNNSKINHDRGSRVNASGMLSDGFSTKAQGSVKFDVTFHNDNNVNSGYSNLGLHLNNSYTTSQPINESSITDYLNLSKFTLLEESGMSTRKSYKSLVYQPKLKKVQHYSDVRTAFRKYNDILRQEGISLKKPPPKKNNQSLLHSIQKGHITIRQPYKEQTVQEDIINISGQIIEHKTSKIGTELEICIVLPEFYNSPEDLGKYAFKFDLLPHLMKYSKIFQKVENLEYLMDLIQELQQKEKMNRFYDILCLFDEEREFNVRSEEDLPSQAEIKKIVEYLKSQDLYTELLRYIVTVYSQSVELNNISLDELEQAMTTRLRSTHDKEYKIDSLMLINGEKVKTVLDISLDTKVIFAGEKKSLPEKFRHMVESIKQHNEDESIDVLISKIKKSWEKTTLEKTKPPRYIPLPPKKTIELNHTSLLPPKERSLNPVKARPLSNSFNVKKDSKPLNNTNGVRDTKNIHYTQKENSSYFQPYIPVRHNRLRNNSLIEDSFSFMPSRARSFDHGKLNESNSGLPDISINPAKIKHDQSRLPPKIKRPSFGGNNTGIEGRLNHSQLSLRENASYNSSSFQLNRDGSANTQDFEGRSSRKRSSIIQVPQEEYSRIKKECPNLDGRDLREIFSHFILLCEVSERARILKQKKKYDAITKFSSSAAARQLKSQDKNWALTKVTLEKCSEEFRVDQLSIESSVSLDVLMEYDEFLSNKSPEMRERVLLAAQVMPDSIGRFHWQNFLNFYSVVIKGRGTAEQQITFLVKLLFPNYEETVTKSFILKILYEILLTNRVLKGKLRSLQESSELIWDKDLEGTGCVENDCLVKERLIQALRNNKTSSDSFIKLLNDQLGMINEGFDEDDEELS